MLDLNAVLGFSAGTSVEDEKHTQGLFHESAAKFSGPKSHLKTMKRLMYRTLYVNGFYT